MGLLEVKCLQLLFLQTWPLHAQGIQEWRNIPAVVKHAFTTLYKQVKAQNSTLQELEARQSSCVQRPDFVSALSGKISIQEHAFAVAKVLHMQRLLFKVTCQPRRQDRYPLSYAA